MDRTDGWDDPPGEGRAYDLMAIQLGPPDLGFDLDGWCRGNICIDNELSLFGPEVNRDIAAGLLAGFGSNIVEVAGVDEPFFGDDARITIKSYEAIDENELGECCRYAVSERSVFGDPFRARWRVPAVYEDGRARHAGIGVLAIDLPLRRGAHLFEVHRPAVRLTSPEDLAPRVSILLGGAIRARDLAEAPNPFCRGAVNGFCRSSDSTMLDVLVDRGLQPDIDLDGDGLEAFEVGDDGRLTDCYDGCSGACTTALGVAPADADAPWTCAESDQIADGYSVAFVLIGRPATVVGVR